MMLARRSFTRATSTLSYLTPLDISSTTARTSLIRKFGWENVNPITYLQRGYNTAWNWYYGGSESGASSTNSQPIIQPPTVPIYVYFDTNDDEQKQESLRTLGEEVTLSFKTSMKLLKKYALMYPRHSWRVASQAAWLLIEKYVEFSLLIALLLLL